jgi:hypothetical protein
MCFKVSCSDSKIPHIAINGLLDRNWLGPISTGASQDRHPKLGRSTVNAILGLSQMDV